MRVYYNILESVLKLVVKIGLKESNYIVISSGVTWLLKTTFFKAFHRRNFPLRFPRCAFSKCPMGVITCVAFPLVYFTHFCNYIG